MNRVKKIILIFPIIFPLIVYAQKDSLKSIFLISKNDTCASNKFNSNPGFSISLATSTLINASLSEYGRSKSSLLYYYEYYAVRPQVSVFLLTKKNKFMIKNEIIFADLQTRYSYTDSIFPISKEQHIVDYFYRVLGYRLNAGMILKKISIRAGFYFCDFISGHGKDVSVYGRGSENDFTFSVKNNFMYGVNLEADLLLSEKWFFGVGTSLSGKLSDNLPSSIFDQYLISTLEFSIGRIMIKDPKNGRFTF